MARAQRCLVLGIDAGATKTEAVVVSVGKKQIRTVARVRGGPASFNVFPVGELCERLSAVVLKAAQKARLGRGSFAAVCIGMAGIDTHQDKKEARAALRSYFADQFPPRLIVVNDVVIALHSGTEYGYGIAVIAGTGSHVYAVSKKGKGVHVGGLGHMLADEGSAYWIALAGLRAAVRAEDGRGRETALVPLFKKTFRVKHMRDISPLIYHRDIKKSDIAALAVVVSEAAEGGDVCAYEILHSAARELALGTLAAAKKARLLQGACDIVCTGGVFSNPLVWKWYRRFVQRGLPDARIRKSARPVQGAVRLALKEIV